MLDWLAGSITHHRGRWAIGLALVFVASAMAASRLTFRHAAGDFLPRNSEPALRMAPGPGSSDRLLVVVRAPHPLRRDAVGPVLDTLAGRLATVEGVRQVAHRLDPAMRAYFDSAVTRHLLLVLPDSALAPLVRDGEAAPAVRAALRYMSRAVDLPRVAVDGGYFTSVDRRTWLVLVEPSGRLDDLGTARALLESMDAALVAARREAERRGTGGASVAILGRAAAYVAGTDQALRDIRRVSVAAAAVVFVLLLVLLRQPAGPILILITTVFGLALTGALAALAWGTVSLVAWFFIVALVGFGDEFAIYIIAHYWFASSRSNDRRAALAAALRRPGPGILLGALTSAAAFLSLVVVSYPVMWQLGLLSALGLLLIVLASYTILPVMLACTAPGMREGPRWAVPMPAKSAPVPAGRGAWLAGFGVAVLACLWLARDVRFEPHPWKVVVRGLPETALLDSVRQQFGMTFAPMRMISQGPTLEAALDRDRAAVEAVSVVQGRAGIAAIGSLSRWIPSGADQRANKAWLEANSARLPTRLRYTTERRLRVPDSAVEARYLPLVRRALEGPWEEVTVDHLRAAGLSQLVGRHVSRDGDRYVVTSEIFLNRLPWEAGVMGRFVSTLQAASGPALDSVAFAGDAIRGATHGATLRQDMLRATSLAVGITLTLLFWRFRRVGMVVLALVPLIAGVAAALATLGVLNLELNVLSLAIAPILIGIGSDDGIHIVERLHSGEPVAVVLAETGAPMMITTVTTIAAFACLALARFPGVREVGIVAAVGLSASLAAALWVVPRLYAPGVRA
jgi:predicted RND superfamily exporter protein